jgi:hypothetical protein
MSMSRYRSRTRRGDGYRQPQHSVRPYVEQSRRGERPFQRVRDVQSRIRAPPSSKEYPYYREQARDCLRGRNRRPREETPTQHPPRADTEDIHYTPTSLGDLLTSLASADFTGLEQKPVIPSIENIQENTTISVPDCIVETSTVKQGLPCIDENQRSTMGCKGCRLPRSPPETYYDEICTCTYCPRCGPHLTTEYDPVYPHYRGPRCVCENFQYKFTSELDRCV